MTMSVIWVSPEQLARLDAREEVPEGLARMVHLRRADIELLDRMDSAHGGLDEDFGLHYIEDED